MLLCDKIKHIRVKLDFNQSEFAKQMDVTQQVVSHYETGRNSPDFTFIEKLIQKFNINPLFFFTNSLEEMFLSQEPHTTKSCNDDSDLKILKKYPELLKIIRFYDSVSEEQNVFPEISISIRPVKENK